MGIRNHTDLIAWQRAMTLSELTYQATEGMPREELFGLTSQIRRAAASMPANIAEGQGRRTDGEFLRFLSLAHGSLRELESHVVLAHNCQEVGRLLNGLMNAIRH